MARVITNCEEPYLTPTLENCALKRSRNSRFGVNVLAYWQIVSSITISASCQGCLYTEKALMILPVQKAKTLYRTRSVRFRCDNKDNFINMMGLKDGMSILEVGCGPGLLCHRLAEWLPNSKITGLDRDENLILYAKNQANTLGVSSTFIQGDALSLPFANNAFDACTSHTVIESVPHAAFLAEQFRVCRPGGCCFEYKSKDRSSY